ncbi:MAG: glycosyltransferase family 39 protein [Candidatus Omnitrophota bacterium]
MMITSFRIIFCIALATAAGWSVISLLSYRKEVFYPAEKLAISYAAGLGLVTVEMALLSVSGISFSVFSIAVPWIPLFLASLLLYGKERGKGPGNGGREVSPPLVPIEKLFLLGTALEVSYTFFRAMAKPIESYDAIAIYAIKAKIFYLARGIPDYFFTGLKDVVPHLEYPLFLPLAETFFYVSIGALNDLLVKCIFPLLFLSALVIFYSAAKRMIKRRMAFLGTFLLATVPQFSEYATNGYADLPLTLYYSASILYLFLWIAQKRNGVFLALSFIFLALAVWTKTEGVMFAFVNIAVISASLIRDRSRSVRAGVAYVVLVLALLGAFLCALRAAGLGLHEDFNTAGLQGRAGFVTGIKRIPAILYEYQRQFFGPKKWNIAWILCIGAFAAAFRKVFSKDLFYMTVAVFLMFGGYTAIYMLTPRDLSWHLSTTASRFFIHLLPVSVFWLMLVCKEKGWEV